MISGAIQQCRMVAKSMYQAKGFARTFISTSAKWSSIRVGHHVNQGNK